VIGGGSEAVSKVSGRRKGEAAGVSGGAVGTINDIEQLVAPTVDDLSLAPPKIIGQSEPSVAA
jgi:hypothetical protein